MILLLMLFLVSLLVFLLVILVKRITNKTEKNINKLVVSDNYQTPKRTEIVNSKVSYGILLQFLESLAIVEETTNLDTLMARIEFINKIYPDVIVSSKSMRFNLDIQKAVDEYKTRYYDKILNDIQINLLADPNEVQLKKHFADCICNCYYRYVERQKLEIQKLLRESAIEKRKDDIIKKGYAAKYMFKTYDLQDEGHQETIEDIRKQFYKYQNK
ncbi:hypothetical protein [Flavobacterium praedii]|uniref:hypothetical protein n=1 Tax=Flavobacterium praedii TaxID=3002900 RepID=UPI002481FFAD|nr:hypothetical protein [Flavobacterium praedii]